MIAIAREVIFVLLVILVILLALMAALPAPGKGDRTGGNDDLQSKCGESVTLEDPDRATHRAALREIVRDPEVMQWVGDGKTWDDKKLDRFFEYTAADLVSDPSTRTNFYYIIVADGAAVGVVGIHPVAYAARPVLKKSAGKKAAPPPKDFLTIFLARDAAGKGIGTEAVRLALAQHWARDGGPVVVDVLASNTAAQRLFKKAGFVAAGTVTIGRRPYVRLAVCFPRKLERDDRR